MGVDAMGLFKQLVGCKVCVGWEGGKVVARPHARR